MRQSQSSRTSRSHVKSAWHLATAVTVKLARVVTVAPIVAGVSFYMRKKHAVEGAETPPLVPLFVVGFIAAMLLRTTGTAPAPLLEAAQMAQTFLLAAAMVGLVLGVRIRGLLGSGSRSLVLAALATVVFLVAAVAGSLLSRRCPSQAKNRRPTSVKGVGPAAWNAARVSDGSSRRRQPASALSRTRHRVRGRTGWGRRSPPPLRPA